MINSRIIGIWDFNIDDDILLWDATMCKIFGYPDKKNIVGDYKMFASLVNPEDMPYVQHEVDKALNLTGHYEAKYRVTKKDSCAETLVHAWGSVFTIEGKTHLIGACDEITERAKIIKEIERLKHE